MTHPYDKSVEYMQKLQVELDRLENFYAHFVHTPTYENQFLCARLIVSIYRHREYIKIERRFQDEIIPAVFNQLE
jgi:hypothetical protein